MAIREHYIFGMMIRYHTVLSFLDYSITSILTSFIFVQGQWNPGVVCSGHFGSVDDFIWDPSGGFAITVSTDQTSRLHAPWIQESNNEVHFKNYV